ncbi:MAG: VOC family protein [Phreatobacter sp.]|nr:VOC family protein [Phreatobacter sp.]
MRFERLVPMLQVSDLSATRAWYEATLGFVCTADDGTGWCRMERDGVALMFMRNAHLGAPHATATQYIYVDDVLGLWDQVRHACEAEWGPQAMPYGLTEFAIRDPDGYLLSFGGKSAA